MKLYGFPGACSLASHVLLRRLGRDFEYVHVDLASGRSADGRDFRTVSPLGYVPALALDGGGVLLEGPAILQFLAESSPHGAFAPRAGLERYWLQARLNLVATEITGPFGALFNADGVGAVATAARERLAQRFAALDDGVWPALGGGGLDRDAAAYALANALDWCAGFHIDLSARPRLAALHADWTAMPERASAVAAERRAAAAFSPDTRSLQP